MKIIDTLAELGAFTIGVIVLIIAILIIALFLIPAFLALVVGFVLFLFTNPVGWALLVILIAGFCCCALAD
ncbi:MAG: hypothetical protein Q7I96_06765 [Methanobacteriaceae archaeon]|nr:hypothetical protein [Methanobacteriaceae archaeon]